MGYEFHETDTAHADAQGLPPSALGMIPGAGPVPLDDMRKRLHDLGNCLTGLVGNLELVEMSLADPEIDMVSLEAALEAGRTSLRQLRELRSHFDGKL
jgi:hypothetical protein